MINTSMDDFFDSLQKQIHYWFVKYNPFFFFSALCILAGIYIISMELGKTATQSSKLALAGVLHSYEILLIAGSALLFRTAGKKRPALILAMLEIVFLF